jgi:hypothetical protein
MYDLKVKLTKTRRYAGKCEWDKSEIVLYLPNLWKSVCLIETEGDLRARIEVFIFILNVILFHEYSHEFMKEFGEHPWTCNRCDKGKCKLCNLTKSLEEYF